MNKRNDRERRRVESAFDEGGLSSIPTIQSSGYRSKHSTEGKPLISKYLRKQLVGSSMALALLAAIGDAHE